MEEVPEPNNRNSVDQMMTRLIKKQQSIKRRNIPKPLCKNLGIIATHRGLKAKSFFNVEPYAAFSSRAMDVLEDREKY